MRRFTRAFASTKDPRGLPAAALRFLEALRAHGYSEETARTWRKALRPFVRWCGRQRVRRPDEVTPDLLEQYLRTLHAHRTASGVPLAASSMNVRVTALRRFFHWLARSGLTEADPASDLERVRAGRRLPRAALSAAEAERVLAIPRVRDVVGLRDRAILETLYATGMRRAELAGLGLGDLDRARELVLIRAGKNDRDRVVPIGERALFWIERYLGRARPRLARAPAGALLFVSSRGGPMGLSALSHLVRGYVLAGGISKQGSCHLFRHTMATLMLENGADLRVIQEILGHASLGTTQIYTHVSGARLKDVHSATHPGARLDAVGPPRRRGGRGRNHGPTHVNAMPQSRIAHRPRWSW